MVSQFFVHRSCNVDLDMQWIWSSWEIILTKFVVGFCIFCLVMRHFIIVKWARCNYDVKCGVTWGILSDIYWDFASLIGEMYCVMIWCQVRCAIWGFEGVVYFFCILCHFHATFSDIFQGYDDFSGFMTIIFSKFVTDSCIFYLLMLNCFNVEMGKI